MYRERIDRDGRRRFAFLAYDQGLEHDPEDFLAVVDGVMRAGGAGGAVGRNVWQRPRPAAAAISKKILARVRA